MLRGPKLSKVSNRVRHQFPLRSLVPPFYSLVSRFIAIGKNEACNTQSVCYKNSSPSFPWPIESYRHVAYSSSSSLPPTANSVVPVYHNETLIHDIVRTIESNEEFKNAGAELQRALQQNKDTQNNDGNTNNNINNNTSISSSAPPLLVHALRQFLHQPQRSHDSASSRALELIAVAIAFTHASEFAKAGAVAVTPASYFATLHQLFHRLNSTFAWNFDSFPEQLVTSWNSAVSNFMDGGVGVEILPSRQQPPAAEQIVPSALATEDTSISLAKVLQTPVDDAIRKAAAEVTAEYREKVLFACGTLREWTECDRTFLSSHVVNAVNCHFRIETDLLNQLGEANGRLRQESISEKNEKKRAEIALRMQENDHFMEKIVNNSSLPPKLLDEEIVDKVKTVGDWIGLRKFWIERPEDILKNKTLEFFASVLSQEIVQLSEISIQLVKNLITDKTIKSLRPGSTPRFSKRALYGLRSRQDEVTCLREILEDFHDNTKEACPLIGVTSLARQGKTSLLDFIGHSPELLRAFDNSSSKTKKRLSSLFVVYITFNAGWNCEIKTDDVSIGVATAKHQLSLRLLADVCGVHDKDHLDERIASALQNLLAIFNDPAKVLQTIIRPRISELTSNSSAQHHRSAPEDRIKLVLLMDEFSNLEPKSSNRFVTEACRKSLYSMMSNLISSRTAVILSGFTAIPDLQTISGRAVEPLELSRFTTAIRRQDSIPMHSQFFRLLCPSEALSPADRPKSIKNAKKSTKVISPEAALTEPLAVHELCKTSPGILGALLERKRHMRSSVQTAISRISFLCTLWLNRQGYWHDMISMLQWKSVQVAADVLGRQENLRMQFQSLASSPSVQRVAHLPRGAVLSPTLHEHLDQIRVDPMFLARTVDASSTSEFATFLRQLYNYAIHVTGRLENVDACQKVLIDRFDSGRAQIAPSPGAIGNINFRDLSGAFFEDAVATGILFQAECRRLFMEQNQVTEIKFTLGDFLWEAQKIGTLHKENGNAGAGKCSLVWSLPENNNNSSTQRQSNSRLKNRSNTSGGAPNLKFDVDELELVWALPDSSSKEGDQLKSPGPSKINYFGFNPNDRKYPRSGTRRNVIPSLDVLHQPPRPELNDLVDIVFHVPLAGGQRWVEVWIDTKQSSSPPFGKIDKNKTRFFPAKEMLGQSLLDNKLLQFKYSNIDHVVHIVISSYEAPTPSRRAPTPPDVDLGRLSSYSLYYVHPDSKAFENLVSQPIKEAIPLLEQHDEKNWAVKVPPDPNAWKYYRAAKRNIVKYISNEYDFTRWRNICFDEDCSIPLDNLNLKLSEILAQKIPELRSVPLGCVIESLDTRPFSVDTMQKQYDSAFRARIMSTGQFEVFGSKQRLVSATSLDTHIHAILSQVSVGHLLHHDEDFWNRLFRLEHDHKTAEVLWSASISDLSSHVAQVPALKTSKSLKDKLVKLEKLGFLKEGDMAD